METVQKFINETVEYYNSGKLTPEKLSLMFNNYLHTNNCKHENNRENLQNANNMLYNTFKKQKGEKIEKLDSK